MQQCCCLTCTRSSVVVLQALQCDLQIAGGAVLTDPALTLGTLQGVCLQEAAQQLHGDESEQPQVPHRPSRAMLAAASLFEAYERQILTVHGAVKVQLLPTVRLASMTALGRHVCWLVACCTGSAVVHYLLASSLLA